MRKYLIVMFIIFLIIPHVYSAENEISENKEFDESFNYNQKKYNILKAMYWSTYGATGLTALINSFAHLGNAYSISNDMISFSNDIKKYGANVKVISQFANYYPAFVFGLNFVTSGSAFIPYAGGIIYGTLCFSVAIAFSSLRSLTTRPFGINIDTLDISVDTSGVAQSEIDNEIEKKKNQYSDEIWDLYSRMLDPTPYFIVGSLSILLGIGEIITGVMYKEERYKRKFPQLGRNLFISPFGIIVRFYI